MLICIPTRDDAGPDARVFNQFGSAPYFTLVDTESGDVQVLANDNATHAHGTCHPMAQLAPYRIDCVVCGGMGRRAIESLNRSGIKVYISAKETVRDIVDHMSAGRLGELDPSMACAGHGSRRGAMCGHEQPSRGQRQGRGAGRPRGTGRGNLSGGQGSGRGRSSRGRGQ